MDMHTDITPNEMPTGSVNYPAGHTDRSIVPDKANHIKAVANQIARLALAGHAVHKGQSGDYTVCKYGMTRYCEDFAELQAFARQLGVNK
jgi:hypothetical protein